MRAVRIVDGTPTWRRSRTGGRRRLREGGEFVDLRSDLHLLDGGIAEGMILGHEFCGIAPDGTPVAVEPMAGCGSCWACDEGHLSFCSNGASSTASACRAVWPTKSSCTPMRSSRCRRGWRSNTPVWSNRSQSRHALDRARVTETDRVLVIGAGPIGLAAAACSATGDPRHGQRPSPPPAGAAEQLGALLDVGDGYDVVIDAVATSASIGEAVLRPPDGPSRVGRHDMAAGRARHRRLHEGDRDPPGDDVPVPPPAATSTRRRPHSRRRPTSARRSSPIASRSTAASRRSQRQPIAPRAQSRWRSTSDRRPLDQAR